MSDTGGSIKMIIEYALEELGVNIEVSTDGITYETYYSGTEYTISDPTQKIYFRNTLNTLNRHNNKAYFVMTGSIQAYGDITAMVNNKVFTEEDMHDSEMNGCFWRLFQDCTSLTRAPDISMEYVPDSGLNATFTGCTNLVNPPNMNAKYFGRLACSGTFKDCTSLIKTPALDIRTVTEYAFQETFRNSGIKKTDIVFNCTTLPQYACDGMFRGCTNLKTLPMLKPLNYAGNMYRDMFNGCSNIKLSSTETAEYNTPWRIPAEGDGTSTSDLATSNMFANTGGTFTGSPTWNSTYYLNGGFKGLKFTGFDSNSVQIKYTSTAGSILLYSLDDGANWSTWIKDTNISVDHTVELCVRNGDYSPSGINFVMTPTEDGKVLAMGSIESLYKDTRAVASDFMFAGLFEGCTALVEAPQIPFTTLKYDGCYKDMFKGCTSLQIAPELPATTLTNNCYEGMFAGCTSLTTLPELNATTLTTACYKNMFSGCKALEAPSQLTATTLAQSCYEGMFNNCSGIQLSTIESDTPYRVPASGTGVDATDALKNMFSNTGGLFTGTPMINTIYYIAELGNGVYHWDGTQWILDANIGGGGSEVIVDDVTIDKTADNKLEVKNLGLDATKLSDDIEGKGIQKSDDGISLESYVPYGTEFPTTPAPVENDEFLLTEPTTDNEIGLYYYDGTDWIVKANYGISSGEELPTTANENDTFLLTEDGTDNEKGVYLYDGTNWKLKANDDISSGTSFPTAAEDKDIFLLEENITNYHAGIYQYDETESDWILKGSPTNYYKVGYAIHTEGEKAYHIPSPTAAQLKEIYESDTNSIFVTTGSPTTHQCAVVSAYDKDSTTKAVEARGDGYTIKWLFNDSAIIDTIIDNSHVAFRFAMTDKDNVNKVYKIPNLTYNDLVEMYNLTVKSPTPPTIACEMYDSSVASNPPTIVGYVRLAETNGTLNGSKIEIEYEDYSVIYTINTTSTSYSTDIRTTLMIWGDVATKTITYVEQEYEIPDLNEYAIWEAVYRMTSTTRPYSKCIFKTRNRLNNYRKTCEIISAEQNVAGTTCAVKVSCGDFNVIYKRESGDTLYEIEHCKSYTLMLDGNDPSSPIENMTYHVMEKIIPAYNYVDRGSDVGDIKYYRTNPSLGLPTGMSIIVYDDNTGCWQINPEVMGMGTCLIPQGWMNSKAVNTLETDPYFNFIIECSQSQAEYMIEYSEDVTATLNLLKPYDAPYTLRDVQYFLLRRIGDIDTSLEIIQLYDGYFVLDPTTDDEFQATFRNILMNNHGIEYLVVAEKEESHIAILNNKIVRNWKNTGRDTFVAGYILNGDQPYFYDHKYSEVLIDGFLTKITPESTGGGKMPSGNALPSSAVAGDQFMLLEDTTNNEKGIYHYGGADWELKANVGGGSGIIPRGYDFPTDASEGDQFILIDKPVEESWIGLWRYNNTLDLSSVIDGYKEFEFICNNWGYDRVLWDRDNVIMMGRKTTNIYNPTSGWYNDIYKDFEVTAEVTDEYAIQWLNLMAVKVPRERLFYYDGSEWQLNPMTNLSPYLTHETFEFTLTDGSVVQREVCIWNS